MTSDYTIVNGNNLIQWMFDERGRMIAKAQTSAANPVMDWMFYNKPIPSHENGVVEK